MNDSNHLFDQLLEMIADMLEQIHKGKLKSDADLPLGIENDLDVLEKNVALFCQINENIVAQENLKPKEMEKIIQQPNDTLSVRQRRLLEKVEKLKTDAESYKNTISKRKKEIQDEKKTSGKQSFGQKRKKKFKSVGGDQNWIPL